MRGHDPAPAEPTSIAAAMSEAVIASIDHPHRFEVVFEQYHRTIYEYLARSVGADRADEYAGDVFVAAFDARVRYDPATRQRAGLALRDRREHPPHPGPVRLAGPTSVGPHGRRARRRGGRLRGRRGESRLREGAGGVAEFLRELSDIDRDVLVLYAWGELSTPRSRRPSAWRSAPSAPAWPGPAVG